MDCYVHDRGHRRQVAGLTPHLARTHREGTPMDPALMSPLDAATCHWAGWRFGKGVSRGETHVFAMATELTSGQHAEMVQGFDQVDPPQGCYDRRHRVHGFGGFLRWVYFAQQGDAVLGVDWSLAERENAGVALSMLDVHHLAGSLIDAGTAPSTTLALLNPQMCEPAELAAWRRRHGLNTLRDWRCARAILAPHGILCGRCGLKTFVSPCARFCEQCGAPKHLVEEPTHGLEI